MKREQHKAEVRKKIIRAARKLFLQQGFDATKIRQISEVAGVKIGTLYHFYKNKEDVFAVIVLESFFRVQDRTQQLTQGNQLLDMAGELAWHVYSMVLQPHSPELYLVSYNASGIAAQLLAKQTERSVALFGATNTQFTATDHLYYAMFAKGIMQSISLRAVDGTLDAPELVISQSVKMLLKIMDTSEADIERTLEQLAGLEMKKRVIDALAKDHGML